MAEINKLTEQDLKDIENELYDLIHIQQEENKRALAAARALGDLSENSDYDFAKSEQARIVGRINELQSIVKNYELIKEERVEIKFLESGKVQEFQIVGVLGTDPGNGKISTECPLAKAVAGRKAGEIISYKSGSGKEIKIQLIRFIG